jgi:triacylglycerol lipase
LGGILLRYYLSQNAIPELGRVVMLGPPNQGSEIVDSLLPLPGFGFIGGPAGVALGTGEDSIIDSLGPVIVSFPSKAPRCES